MTQPGDKTKADSLSNPLPQEETKEVASSECPLWSWPPTPHSLYSPCRGQMNGIDCKCYPPFPQSTLAPKTRQHFQKTRQASSGLSPQTALETLFKSQPWGLSGFLPMVGAHQDSEKEGGRRDPNNSGRSPLPLATSTGGCVWLPSLYMSPVKPVAEIRRAGPRSDLPPENRDGFCFVGFFGNNIYSFNLNKLTSSHTVTNRLIHSFNICWHQPCARTVARP